MVNYILAALSLIAASLWFVFSIPTGFKVADKAMFRWGKNSGSLAYMAYVMGVGVGGGILIIAATGWVMRYFGLLPPVV